MLKYVMSTRVGLNCFKAALDGRPDGRNKSRACSVQLGSVVGDGNAGVIGVQNEE